MGKEDLINRTTERGVVLGDLLDQAHAGHLSGDALVAFMADGHPESMIDAGALLTHHSIAHFGDELPTQAQILDSLTFADETNRARLYTTLGTDQGTMRPPVLAYDDAGQRGVDLEEYLEG